MASRSIWSMCPRRRPPKPSSETFAGALHRRRRHRRQDHDPDPKTSIAIGGHRSVPGGALRSNNAALVNRGSQYRILPADQANVGASLRADDSIDPEQVGSGLQVVQLKFVAASEISRLLESIAPRGGIVRTDDARNLITLSGSRQDIATMMDYFEVDEGRKP